MVRKWKNKLHLQDVIDSDAVGHTHGSDLVPGIGPDDVATAKSAGKMTEALKCVPAK